MAGTYDAGEARAKYSLDTAGFDAAIARIKKQYEDLAKAAAGSGKAPTVAPSGNVNQAIIAAQRLATEQQRTAKTAQAVATEEQRTAAALANVTSAQNKAELSAVRLGQAQKKAAADGAALPRTFAGFTAAGAGQAAAAFGLATLGPQIVGQAINGGVQAAQAALALRETKNSLKAVAGDMRTYNEVLGAARQQQVLFGGSLQENIEGLSGLTITARSSGASLQTLINLSQRLGVLDPAQGAAGARIALNEALSGDPTSLAKRYEIPRAALAKLRDTTIPVEERLKVIDSFLNKVGITAESVAGKVDQDALAFRTLGQEAGDLAINVGDKLAGAFSGAATGLSRLIGVINGNPEALAKLVALTQGRDTISSTDVSSASAFLAQRSAQSQLGGGSEGFTGGVAASKLGAQKQAAQDLLATLIFTGEAGAEAGRKATDAFLTSSQSGDAYIQTLRELIVQSQAQKEATTEVVDKLNQELTAKVSAQIETDKFSQLQRQLAADSLLAAKGLLGPGDQALILAQKYNIAGDAAQYLINQQAFIAGQGAKKSTAARALTPSSSDGLLALAQGRQITGSEIKASQDKVDTEKKRIADAQLSLDLARAKTSADKIAIYKRELAKTTDKAEQLRLQTQIAGEQNSADKKVRAKADPNAKGLGALATDDIKLAGDEAARLAEVNAQLARGNLTTHQRNQLLIQQRDLEEKISAEKDKQLQAAVDLRLDSIRNEQSKIKEAREAAGLQRALAGGRLSDTQTQAVQLRLQEISAEQDKRRLDIAKETRASGGVEAGNPDAIAAVKAQAAITGPLPLIAASQLPTVPAIVPTGGQVVVNLALTIDRNGQPNVTSADPNIVLNLLGGSAKFRNLSGG